MPTIVLLNTHFSSISQLLCTVNYLLLISTSIIGRFISSNLMNNFSQTYSDKPEPIVALIGANNPQMDAI